VRKAGIGRRGVVWPNNTFSVSSMEAHQETFHGKFHGRISGRISALCPENVPSLLDQKIVRSMERSRYRSGVMSLEPIGRVSAPVGWKGIGLRTGKVSVPFQKAFMEAFHRRPSDERPKLVTNSEGSNWAAIGNEWPCDGKW